MGKMKKQTYGACVVCKDKAEGKYFGAIVCLPCKSFFIRCTKEGPKRLSCHGNKNCDMTGGNRMRCSYCRHQKCLAAGMARKEKPERIEPDEGQELCRVCNDIANGVHFGVTTCEGCKKFFRRAMKEYRTYRCKFNQTCTINPRNRNTCRSCRYNKCLQLGMSRTAIRMGRPRKLREILQPGGRDLDSASRRGLGSMHGQGYASLSSASAPNNCMYSTPWLDSYTADPTSGSYLCLPDTYGYYGYCVDKTSFLLKSLEDVVNRLNVEPPEDTAASYSAAAAAGIYVERRQSFMIQGGGSGGYSGGIPDASGPHSAYNQCLVPKNTRRGREPRDFMQFGPSFEGGSNSAMGSTQNYSAGDAPLSHMDFPRRAHSQGIPGDSLLSLGSIPSNSTYQGVSAPDAFSGLTVSTSGFASPNNSIGHHSLGHSRSADFTSSSDFTSPALHKHTDPTHLNFSHAHNNNDELKYNYNYGSVGLERSPSGGLDAAVDFNPPGYGGDKKGSHASYPWGAGSANSYLFSQHGAHHA